MNFPDIEMLYINIYVSVVLFKIFSAFNEFYKYDTQLYNTIWFAFNNINNFLFFKKAYNDVPVYAILEPSKPTVIPYEQRYLEKVRLIPNNYVFSPSETQIMNDKLQEISIEQKELQNKLNCLHVDNIENTDDSLQAEITDLQKQILTPEDVLEKARAYVINARLNTLINNVIMENTPLGNVIMMYDNNRETFNFYSDNMIPYRYLETVARKYVITYNCRPLYIDMEEELKIYEKKMLEHEENEKINNEKTNIAQLSEPKKNVFAKFKSYNTEGKSGHVGKVAGPQNSVQNKDTGNNRKIILKDNANRYSCQGKIHNFSIIKKPEKKLLSKKLAMTFATFKQKTGLGNI
jgi:hypothetical protein